MLHADLSVERNFRDKDVIPKISNTVQNATHVADKRSPSKRWSAFRKKVWLFCRLQFPGTLCSSKIKPSPSLLVYGCSQHLELSLKCNKCCNCC